MIYAAAGNFSLRLKQYREAAEYLRTATTFPETTQNDWLARLGTNLALKDDKTAIECVTAIASRWPNTLKDIDSDDLINRLANQSSKLADHREEDFALLAALFRANWKMYVSYDPAHHWRRYILLLIERSDFAMAAEVVTRINSYREAVIMLTDRRYDPVTSRLAVPLSAEAALTGEIAQWRSIAENQPRTLGVRINYLRALMHQGEHAEAVSLAQAALAQHAKDGNTFADADAHMPGMLNTFGDALIALGRIDEGLEQLERARKLPENGGPNVSQAINLASAYCLLNRPNDVFRVLPDRDRASDYGKLAALSNEICAEALKGDQKAVDRDLKKMRELRRVSPSAYLFSLARASQPEEFSRWLAEALADPDLRSDVLYSLQTFLRPPMHESYQAARNRFTQYLNSPANRDEIDKVGRIMSFNIYP
jgi:tetratricopeptide (TPR) repeat protein